MHGIGFDCQRKSLAKFTSLLFTARMNMKSSSLSAALLAVTLPFLQAAGEPMTQNELKEVVRIDSLTIPMPGEFFAAIEKVGRPSWGQFVRSATPQTSASRAQIALALGTLVADGYIAVEAQDGQSVKNIGKEIVNLAKKLNVSQSVLGRGGSINDFAENNDWNALREELEATQNEVKLDMADQNDSSLITLVTIGAWIRGTELGSGIVKNAYSPEYAALLRQPAIVEYLISQVDKLPPNFKDDPLVMKVRAGLEKVLPEVTASVPTAENINALNAEMVKLSTDITAGTPQS